MFTNRSRVGPRRRAASNWRLRMRARCHRNRRGILARGLFRHQRLPIDGSMNRTLSYRLFTLVAALLVAVASVVSAARMVPDTSGSPDAAVFLTAGATINDFCGGLPTENDHHCPFCRLQPDPPEISLASQGECLSFTLAWQSLNDLSLAPQRGNPYVSARAPPAQA